MPSVKGLFGRIHLSRKLVIVVGGFLVLLGGTGAAAVFIGADTLLGPSYAEVNGMACTEIRTVQITKKDRFWIRKYVSTEPGDGLTRVKTALRIAAAVYDAEKPDLVQVVVLDKNGPTDRAGMRGRAIGADVVYIPDPSRVPEETGKEVLTARFVDKQANAAGQFYGERLSLPEADVTALFAKLDDRTDCIKPEIEGEDGHGSSADHAAPADHGEAASHEETGGHGETDDHGDDADAGHGEALPGDDGHAVETSHGDTAPAEGGGWFASIKGMVVGGEEAPTEDHGTESQTQDAAVSDHGEERVISIEVTSEAVTDGHEETVSEAADHAIESPAETSEAPSHGSGDSHEEAAITEDGKGWLGSLKDMVWGNSGDHKGELPEETMAKDVPQAGGDADQAGAAWLAKLKRKAVADAEEHSEEKIQAPSHSEVPAEDSDYLPPKSTTEHDEAQADAGH